VDYAKQKSAELLDKDMITVSARHQSENILAQAYVEGDRIRAEADAYVVEVLRDLESHLLRTLTVVRNGIAKVMQDREASQQARANAAAAHATPAEAPATLTLPKREEVLVER
jgi:hypothetical protein